MSTSPHTNRLIQASSPYLLQHAHNPVDWFTWGEEALEKARRENKLLIISIGYAACHWCHVMEKESFENEEVATLMNAHFVCIKIDREERPDLDHVYMNAAYITAGRGGWPLNAVALPDGRPFFAGTYFPKQQWMNVLSHFAGFWQNDRAQLEDAARQVTEGIYRIDEDALKITSDAQQSTDTPGIAEGILELVDTEKGGLERSPKFPMPDVFRFLLRFHFHSGDARALQAVDSTLQRMLEGGIYDQAGGGFARYSTDDIWFAPHFEKMLYDNAQLISLYSEAYRVTRNPAYRKVVYETLRWVEEEMTAPDNSFYSAIDADSEGEEGRFYTWKSAEVDALLGDDAAMFKAWFSITEDGNWEHTNILYIGTEKPEILERFGTDEQAFDKKIREGLDKLHAARSLRVRPITDDKALTSWNALMVSAYMDAFAAFAEEKWLRAADRNLAFLEKEMLSADGRLFRAFGKGKAAVTGFLDDYAFMAEALYKYYMLTGDERRLGLAERIIRVAIDEFSDPETGMFYYTPASGEKLVVRTKEVSDNVIASSGSVMAQNLHVLGKLLDNDAWISRSERMTRMMKPRMKEQPAYASRWASVLLCQEYGTAEVAVTGDAALSVCRELAAAFLPSAFLMPKGHETGLELLLDKPSEAETRIYICSGKSCQAPVKTAAEALILLQK